MVIFKVNLGYPLPLRSFIQLVLEDDHLVFNTSIVKMYKINSEYCSNKGHDIFDNPNSHYMASDINNALKSDMHKKLLQMTHR